MEPDRDRLLKEFMRISRRRPQSMGKVPQALPAAELKDGWELSGLKGAITRKDFVQIMEELDAALIGFYIKRDG